MLVGTIIGFITVFQTRALAGGPVAAPLDGVRGRLRARGLACPRRSSRGRSWTGLDIPVLEVWGILAMHILAVASFASLMTVLIGRWAIVPTWLFFVVLGNSSSGGAVSPPLLPAPFAFVSQWLPSGATVTSLRDAIYFPATSTRGRSSSRAWAAALLGAMLVASYRRGTSPGAR